MPTWEQYDFSNKSRGKALIFNNVHFKKKMPERKGSDCDVESLVAAFKSIGFAQDNIQVEKDKTTVEMKILVENCMKWKEHADSDCFVFVILSHGDISVEETPDGRQRLRTDRVCGTEGPIPLKDLIKTVQDCKALDGKPKIFIVQACRGLSVSESVTVKKPVTVDEPACRGLPVSEPVTVEKPVTVDESVPPPNPPADSSPTPPGPDLSETEQSTVDASPMEPRYEDEEHALPHDIPVDEDCLLLYATQPGFISFRRETGTPFIGRFCKQVEDNKDSNFDLLSLLTRVNHDVAFEYESKNPKNPGLNRKKMMPWVASRLTKHVVFGRLNK